MATWKSTDSERWLQGSRFFDDRDRVEAMAKELDRCDTVEQVQTVIMRTHKDPCGIPEGRNCHGCERTTGAVIAHLVHWFRAVPDLSFADAGHYSPVLDAIRRAIVLQPKQQHLSGHEIETYCMSLMLAAEHYAHGLHVYEVSEGLIERFKLSTTKGVHTDDLRLPYPAVWFQLPEGTIRTPNTRGTVHDITGVFIREFNRNDIRSLDVAVYGKAAFTEDQEALLTTISTPFTVDWVVRLKDAARYQLLDDPTLLPKQRAPQDTMYEFMAPFWDVLVNIIMFATWPQEGAVEEVEFNSEVTRLKEQVRKHPPGHKRQRAQEKLRRTMPRHRHILGRNVRLFPPNTSTITVRTLVQGHWQRFAVGTGRQERRWQYREPYWRGPVDAPISQKRHALS